MAENRIVIGVFEDHRQAEHALYELRHAGFSDEHIGFIRREQQRTEPLPTEVSDTDTSVGITAGAVTGSVVGGLIGAVAALLIPGVGPAIAGGILTTTLGGAAIGAAAGGLLGALIHIGVPEEEAHFYDREFQSGRTIVIVQADERPMDAYQILECNRAYNASTPRTIADDPQATVEL